jgi:hypothetical protein
VGWFYLKGFVKFLILILSVIVILAAVYFILLYPKHEYPKIHTSFKTIDIKSQITKKMPNKFSFSNRKLTFDIELSEEDLKGELVSRLSNKDFQNVDVEITNDNITVFLTKKAYNYIPYEIILVMKPEVREGQPIIVLNSSKLGRLNLSKEIVLNKVKDLKYTSIDVRPSEGELVLQYNELKDVITINAIKLQDNKLSAELQIEFNSLEDFLKVLNLLT